MAARRLPNKLPNELPNEVPNATPNEIPAELPSEMQRRSAERIRIEHDRMEREVHAPPPKRRWIPLVLLLLLIGAGAGGWLWWQHQSNLEVPSQLASSAAP